MHNHPEKKHIIILQKGWEVWEESAEHVQGVVRRGHRWQQVQQFVELPVPHSQE